ncbi:hypothetical protein D3C72_1027990 [compost metagenome]
MAQLNLNLLHLSFVPLLFLISLLLDCIAVMLQGVSGMKVLLFQGADLLILLLHTELQVSAALAQARVTSEFGLQACLTGL